MSNSSEIMLEGTAFLITETDLKGVIKFANSEFCKTTGYKYKELIGKAHNIVRHPDMPNTVFESLWGTISKGKTWTGCIKNKTRNGDFYWCFATIFPHSLDSELSGYISCRRKATNDEISTYKKFYERWQ